MRLLVLPGDGIGPEIAEATLSVLEAVDRRFALDLSVERREIGLAALAARGTTLPDDVVAAAAAADGVILGPVSHYEYPPVAEGGVNPSAWFRTRFGLGTNVRPARGRPGVSPLGERIDLVIVREGTEGFYADRSMHAGSGEFMPDPDTALAVRKVTAAACRRVAVAAFELAGTRRRRVTAVHKANVLKLSDGLFLRVVREVASGYPDIAFDEVLVDAAAALIIRTPERFDVIVTTNMFGDILSDAAAELSGGLGLAGSVNVGEAMCVAQAQHGSAPDIAGRDVANPVSLVLSAAMLLAWLGRRHDDSRYLEASMEMERMVDVLLSRSETRTRDLAGPLGTAAFGSTLARGIEEGGMGR